MLVRGVVQGVGFRWHSVQQARALAVVGWVRNRQDGCVEAHIQGGPEAVEALIAWMRRGPRSAHVESLSAVDAAPELFAGFREIR